METEVIDADEFELLEVAIAQAETRTKVDAKVLLRPIPPFPLAPVPLR